MSSSRFSQVEGELAAARRSDEVKSQRLSQAASELAAAQRSEEAKSLRLSQVEADLAATRRSEETKALRLAQIEAELATARRSEETKVLRLSQVEAELAATQRSEDAKTSRLYQLEAELAALRRSNEITASRLARVEAELATVRRESEEAKRLLKQMEEKDHPRRLTPEQRTQFLNAVRGLPKGKVILSAVFHNKETHAVGAEILSLLKDSGFNVIEPAPLDFFTAGRPSSGLRIGYLNGSTEPPHVMTLRKGFNAIGLDPPTTNLINAHEDDVVEIQVTPKQ